MMATYSVDLLRPTKANFQRLVQNFKKLQERNYELELINEIISKHNEEYNHIRSLLTFRIWGVGAPVGNLQIMERLQKQWKTQKEIEELKNNESVTETKTSRSDRRRTAAIKQLSKSNPGTANADKKGK